MDVVDIWTGGRANALQRALRLTNEAFADRLGTAVRTVAKWNGNPDTEPGSELQQALDTVLHQADDQVKARFSLLLARGRPGETALTGTADAPAGRDTTEAERRMSTDPNVGAALDWVEQKAGWSSGTARKEVLARIAALEPNALRDRRSRRSRVDQHQLATALQDYYAGAPAGWGTYAARIEQEQSAITSVLTSADWLDLRCVLTPENDQLDLERKAPEYEAALDDFATDKAIQRIAETLEEDTRLVNASLYRLLEADVGPGKLRGSFGIAEFVQYALTMDLLEGEMVDAIAEGRSTRPGDLPLRDHYLPDAGSVLDTRQRLCAGGPLALCAIARPARGRRPADYVLLVQERGGNVLNASRRLAPIPKSFHEPLIDQREDTQIGLTLQREMEEELFGRDDVDNTISPQRSADPMHPSRLSAPMRWLTENSDQWLMECTGLGLNLVSGNYEFASLIVIQDEEFWQRFGGQVEANWESSRLQQFSSMDRELLAELAADVAWSNEGLFAFLQGLRRLSELDSPRVDAPAIEWEIQ
ncbi:transcriptional regulator [Saccharopolyspora sp. NPDC049426]|uniref:transcriptional regulator n=1 Tax=Saccharopolyspora sp. NPDC049426 TaxID=3155652 RepID=UPI00341BEB70